MLRLTSAKALLRCTSCHASCCLLGLCDVCHRPTGATAHWDVLLCLAVLCCVLQTAFNFFAAEQWANLRGELGANAAPQDISRLIGERWNKTPEDERAPYIAKAQEDKARYEKEMEAWRSGLEAAAAAAAADSAAADGDADVAAAGAASPGADAMDVDIAAAAVVKQEQRSTTPPKPHHPKIKLKMSGGTGRHTPPPPAVSAAAGEAGGPVGVSVPAEAPLPQEHQQQGGDVDAGAAAVSPSLPAAEPQEQQQQPMPAAAEAVLAPAAAAVPAGPASPVLGGAAAPSDSMAVDAPAAVGGAPAAGEEGAAQ
jgi:hypothetical protein